MSSEVSTPALATFNVNGALYAVTHPSLDPEGIGKTENELAKNKAGFSGVLEQSECVRGCRRHFDYLSPGGSKEFEFELTR